MGTTTILHSPTYQPTGSLPPLSSIRIILITAAMCGIQICYSAQINLGTSELLRLGIPPRIVSLAWLAGPLSGLIVQPIVGHVSDTCASPLGRRRPFLIAGTLFTALSLLLFANATPLSALVVDTTLVPKLALNVAIVAFFLLDFSIQAIQAPLRALVTDVVPKTQRAFANSYIAVFTGLGNCIGGVLTAIHLPTLLHVFDTQAQALFAIAAVVLVVCVAITVVASPEKVIKETVPREEGYSAIARDEEEEAIQAQQESRDVITALKNVPTPFWQVFMVQLCTWCGFFALFVYVNTWVGTNVYGGDGSAPKGSSQLDRFERGVRLGGTGNAATAVVTLVWALALPPLLRRYGVKKVYMGSQAVEALTLMAAPFIRGKVTGKVSWLLKLVTVADIGLFGIVWATTMAIPWTLVGDALEKDEWYDRRTGLFTTLFNASQSAPQLAVAFVAPAILAMANEDPSWVMFAGGVCAAIGMVLVGVLKLGGDEDARQE